MKGVFQTLARSWRHKFNVVTEKESLLPGEQTLFQFRNGEDLNQWQIFSDHKSGGKSTASLLLAHQAATFGGHYSKDRPNEEVPVVRSGICVINTKWERGGPYMDLEQYAGLRYRVRGDGLTYIANIRADSFIGHYDGYQGGYDIWQVPFRPKAGQWRDIIIPFDRFVATRAGRLVVPRAGGRMELLTNQIVSVGVALAITEDMAAEGPFALQLQHIQALSISELQRALNTQLTEAAAVGGLS